MYRKIIKQTAIYGVAMVFPRMLSFFLVRLYTNTDVIPTKSDYGDLTIVLSWMVFFNVVLSYGFETSFFRFYNTETKKNVISTSIISIFWSSIIFLLISLFFKNSLAEYANVKVEYIVYSIWILALDSLAVIPFSILRVNQQPIRFAFIKIGNVILNLALNFFLLIYLPRIISSNPDSIFKIIYFENFQLGYIFIANLIASLLTLLMLSPYYFTIKWVFDKSLWRQMMNYGLPILVAGLAFAVNEHFDKILLGELLPAGISKSEVGAYSACYKLGLLMVLYRTAFTMGIEPFFFSHAGNENAPKTYATITKYFVILGSLISLGVIVFADLLKLLLLDNKTYWDAMGVVPIIVYANFFLGIYINLSVWYKLINKTKIGAYISLIGAFITLFLNFILIPYISFYGSAIATFTAYFSMMFISYFWGKSKYPIPYNIKIILRYISLSFIISSICFYIPFIRENYFIKVGFLLVFIGFVYRYEKNTINQILKSFSFKFNS